MRARILRRSFYFSACPLCYYYCVEKEKIRWHLLRLREAQSVMAKNEKDKKILRRLGAFLPFKNAYEFFTYLSHRGEVSTDPLLKKYLGKKKIIVPKIDGEEICLYELKNATRFEKGKFGIREPKFCLPLGEVKKISVALIPGIAFDLTGHRIGYGGGYFDRFLKKVHCTTIALAYEFQIIDKVPAHKYDVPVDYIITEKRIIYCKVKI